MRGSSFGYLMKEGARNIYANKQMSVASIGVLVACMLLIGASVLFSMNVNSFVGYTEQQNEVAVFLVDGTTDGDRNDLEIGFSKISNIIGVRYVSRDEGLEDWISSMSGVSDASEELFEPLFEDNVLPDAYYLKVQDLSILDETVAQVQKMENVDTVRAPVEVAKTITILKQAVTMGGTAIVVLLVGVASVIIANTIKITVFNRRKEISIMKFVGATDTFIRLPFIVEGLLLGLLSATIAFFMIWGLYEALLSWLVKNPVTWFGFLLDNMVVFKSVALQLFGSFALTGVTIGTVGSVIFVRKYLKV